MRSNFNDDFDRQFNRTRKLILTIILVSTVVVLGMYVIIGVIAVKAAKDPEKTIEKAGETARSWKEAFEKGYKVEVSDSTITDTLIVE